MPERFDGSGPEFKKIMGASKTLWYRLVDSMEFCGQDVFGEIPDGDVEIAHGGRIMIAYASVHGSRRARRDLRERLKRDELNAEKRKKGSTKECDFVRGNTATSPKLVFGASCLNIMWMGGQVDRKYKKDAEEDVAGKKANDEGWKKRVDMRNFAQKLDAYRQDELQHHQELQAGNRFEMTGLDYYPEPPSGAQHPPQKKSSTWILRGIRANSTAECYFMRYRAESIRNIPFSASVLTICIPIIIICKVVRSNPPS